MNRIVVILPAYNEEQTVSATIEDFNRHLPQAAIWVVNNGSTDATESIAVETLSRLGCNGGVIKEHRLGKGNAVRRAFYCIDADVYVLADADTTYPAAQVSLLIAPVLADDADMVVGDRQIRGRYAAENKRALHTFGNRVVRTLVNKLFKSNLADIMSGYRVFNRDFVKNYPILVEGFEIETDMTVHALDRRFRIVEIPVDYRDRPVGSFSKLSTLRDGIRVLRSIWNILRHCRPLLFFGSVSILFAILGIITGMPAICDWMREKYVHHIPLAILAVGFEMVSFVLMAIGLILDSVVRQHKMFFEQEILNKSATRK